MMFSRYFLSSSSESEKLLKWTLGPGLAGWAELHFLPG